MTNAREFTNHLAELLRKERGVMTDFILALADFDRKQLWRELGHTSLFYFLHRELKLSKGAAYNRKVAAELVQAFPAVEAALRSGELCMSTVTEVARVVTAENCVDVLPRFFGLSHLEAKDVSASLRPARVIPLRDVVTALQPAAPALEPVAAQAVLPVTPAVRPVQATALPLATPDVSPEQVVHVREPVSRPASPASASLPPAPPAEDSACPEPVERTWPEPVERVEFLDAELARLHVTVTRRLLWKLEAAKDALGHACRDGTAAEILERGLDLVLAQHAKRQGLVEKPLTKPRPRREPLPGEEKRETVPAAVKREVWRRAGGRCEWKFESGERCDCRRRLEYDHVQPEALGGKSTVENVRLVGRPHNQLAREIFGDALMNRYTRVRPSAANESLPVRRTRTARSGDGGAERPLELFPGMRR
jgi:hypothetical protein